MWARVSALAPATELPLSGMDTRMRGVRVLVPKGSGQGLKPGMRATVGLHILLLQAAHGHTALPAFQGSLVVGCGAEGLLSSKAHYSRVLPPSRFPVRLPLRRLHGAPGRARKQACFEYAVPPQNHYCLPMPPALCRANLARATPCPAALNSGCRRARLCCCATLHGTRVLERAGCAHPPLRQAISGATL